MSQRCIDLNSFDPDKQHLLSQGTLLESSEGDAHAAIQALDGAELDGRNIKVNEAQERKARSGGGGGNRW